MRLNVRRSNKGSDLGADLELAEDTRVAERAESQRIRTQQRLLATGVLVAAVARLLVEYVQSRRDGTEAEFFLIGVVMLAPLVPLIAWLVRPRWVARKLGTREELATRMARTRDRYLSNQLLWIEYAMARSQARTGQEAIVPADYTDDVQAATNGMAFASSAVSWTYALMMFSMAALCIAVAVWIDLFVVLVPIAVFLLAMGILPLMANHSKRSRLGRRILGTRGLDDDVRWKMLLEIARDDLTASGGLHA